MSETTWHVLIKIIIYLVQELGIKLVLLSFHMKDTDKITDKPQILEVSAEH